MVWRVFRFVGLISSFTQVGFPGKRQRVACRAFTEEAPWDLELWKGGERSSVEQREERSCEAQLQPQRFPGGALCDSGHLCMGHSVLEFSPPVGALELDGPSESSPVVASSAPCY